MKKPFSLFLIFWAFRGYGQTNDLDTFFARISHYPVESVYIHCDRYAAAAGDTIWWKGYVFEDGSLSTLSHSLLIDLFREDGTLIWRAREPILSGLSVGQVALPDSLRSGQYWLRAYTRYQLNFDSTHLFCIPLSLWDKHDTAEIYPLTRFTTALFPVVQSFGQVMMTTSKTDTGLTVHLDAASDFQQFGAPMRIVLTSYHRPLVSAALSLTADRPWKDLVFPLSGDWGWKDLLLFAGNHLLGRQSVYFGLAPDPVVQVVADTLSEAPGGYNSWKVRIPGLTTYNCSISVTDADGAGQPPAVIADGQGLDPFPVEEAFQEQIPLVRAMDTAYLSWEGTLETAKGTRLNDVDLVTFLTKGDEGNGVPRLVHVGSDGHFTLDHALFFDTAFLSFSLNGMDKGARSKDLRILLPSDHFPGFVPPADFDWKHRPKAVRPAEWTVGDTTIPRGMRVKELPRMIVKGDALKELDDRYATGIFSEPTPLSFDVRLDKSVRTIWQYLRKNLPGFIGGPDIGQFPQFNGKGALFFVDGEPQSVEDIGDYWYEEIAYIKAYPSLWVDETGFLKWKTGYTGFSLQGGGALKVPVSSDPPVICLYTRKGKDIRTGWPSMPRITLHGYTRAIPWTGDSEMRPTYFWQPLESGNEFRIRFYNRNAEHFRICIEGVSSDGKPLHFETIIPSP